MVSESIIGHRTHIKDLIRTERDQAYCRKDYLSSSHQIQLWQAERQQLLQDGVGLQTTASSTPEKRVTTTLEDRQSPSSVITDPSSPSSSTTASLPYRLPEAPSEICVRWREKIIEWKYQIVDRFDLSREIVSISTFYLDQYLSKHYVDEELFQLVAMASVYLAIKIHGHKKVTISSIASTGNGLITVKHIEAMELSIMNSLEWRLFPPTCVSFVENFYPLIANDCCANKKDVQHLQQAVSDSFELSRFLAELSVCAYPFITAKPSSIAIAAILYSFEHFGVPQDVRDAFTQTLWTYDLSLEVIAPEVEACKRVLRKVYDLATQP